MSFQEFNLSTDNGLTWDSLASISTGSSELIEIGDVLLSASSYARIPEDLRPLPCVFRSEDSGRSWDSVLAGVYGASSIALSGPTLYANPDGRLFSSADTGETWTRVDGAGVFTDYISDECSHVTQPGQRQTV